MRIDLTGSRDDLPLEERISRLEDVQTIQTLWAHYAYLADTEDDGAGIAALHVEEATWKATGPGNFGAYEGKEAIAGFFTNLYSVSPFRHHGMTNVYVDLADDRQSATGRWKLTDMCTMGIDGGQAVLLLGDYENTFVKHEGIWKIKDVRLTSTAWTDWERGWAAQPDRDAVGAGTAQA
jgi:hypothetical protein